MIIEEILKIENHPIEDEIGKLENDLYNEFRGGRDRNDILILLNSDIDSMRYYGCDILNETRINNIYLVKKIIDKLCEILKKDNSDMNRLRAFHALYGVYLENEDIIGLFHLCEEMKSNEDQMIKRSSIRFLEKYNTAPLNFTFQEFKNHLFNNNFF